jgi:hypothetical protein
MSIYNISARHTKHKGNISSIASYIGGKKSTKGFREALVTTNKPEPRTASIIYPNIVIRCKLKYYQVKRKCGKMYIKIHLLLEQILDNHGGNIALKVRNEISTLIKTM